MDWILAKVKPGKQILQSLTEQDCELLHASLGITTEAAELADAIKKYTIYRKPLDLSNVVEELADIYFWMHYFMRTFSLDFDTLELVLKEKLDKRYPTGYSDSNAQARLDKQTEDSP